MVHFRRVVLHAPRGLQWVVAAGLAACSADLEPAMKLSGSSAPDATVDAGVAHSDAAPAVRPDAKPPVFPDASVAMDAAVPPPPDAGLVADSGLPNIGETCFADIFDPANPGPNYDQFNPVVGSHCLGTNHQDITNIERVVFLGDSVTQGSPPTPIRERYRFVLGDLLRDRFGPDIDVDNCAAWGARTDDLLMPPHQQIHECFSEMTHPERTLVVMTIGGNDVASVQKDGADGAPYAQTRASVEQFVQYLREAIQWFYEDPNRFPNGVFVVFANMFEFTDGTGEVGACPVAGLAGFNGEWPDAEELVIWANEQFMSIAVETGTDMIFMLEHFCGHGFNNDDPTNRCYRGPNTERWFDLTCIHPNPTGHGVIADMFINVIDE